MLGGCALLFALIHLFEYLIEHIVYLVRNASWSGAISIDQASMNLISLIAEYAVDTIEIVSLGIMALMVLYSLTYNRIKSTLILGTCIVLTKTLYILPHYYMTFVLSYGYDSVEAIIMILPLLFFIILITAAILFTIVILACLPAFRKAKRQEARFVDVLGEDMERLEYLNLGNSSTAALAIASLLSAGVHIFIAIFDTVDAFGSYGASLPPAVILSLIGRYIFLVILFISLHFLLCFIKGLLFKEPKEMGEAHTEGEAESGEKSVEDAASTPESTQDVECQPTDRDSDAPCDSAMMNVVSEAENPDNTVD